MDFVILVVFSVSQLHQNGACHVERYSSAEGRLQGESQALYMMTKQQSLIGGGRSGSASARWRCQTIRKIDER